MERAGAGGEGGQEERVGVEGTGTGAEERGGNPRQGRPRQSERRRGWEDGEGAREGEGESVSARERKDREGGKKDEEDGRNEE